MVTQFKIFVMNININFLVIILLKSQKGSKYLLELYIIHSEYISKFFWSLLALIVIYFHHTFYNFQLITRTVNDIFLFCN